MSDTFYETNSRYGSGLMLDKYNEQYGLVEARQANNGEVYKKWGFTQTKEREPANKAIPWKVNLGTKVEALEVLRFFMQKIQDDGQSLENDEEQPTQYDSDIPF